MGRWTTRPTSSPGSATPPGRGSRPRSPSPPRPGGRLADDRGRHGTPWSSRPPGRARRSRVPVVAGPAASSQRPADKLKRCRVLYVSPLKALAVDVERNLRAPLAGIRHDRRPARASRCRRSRSASAVRRHPAADRRRLATSPPDILITTPESLFLMLTSQARESLRGVETVIIDEVHAVAGTKRGAHLAVLPRAARRAAGAPGAADRALRDRAPGRRGRPVPRRSRPVEVVAPPSEKQWDLRSSSRSRT